MHEFVAAPDPDGEPGPARALPERGCAGGSALAVASLCAVLLAATMLWTPPVLLLWNASASAPVGLYRVHTGDSVRPGDMAIAWAPRSARKLASERHYLPANVPLVKRVAAGEGDQVCAGGKTVLVNRRLSARRRTDASGRPMPWWNGCRSLGRGDYFLLMDRADSFDGRYFGITHQAELVGRAVPLWAG